MTTSNPNPDSPADTVEFLPSALLTAWQGKGTPEPAAALACTGSVRVLRASARRTRLLHGNRRRLARSGRHRAGPHLSERLPGIPARLPVDAGRGQPQGSRLYFQQQVPRHRRLHREQLPDSGSLHQARIRLHAGRQSCIPTRTSRAKNGSLVPAPGRRSTAPR